MIQFNEDLIIWIDETESTNLYLKERLAESVLPNGTLVVADYQTKGRGQQGNSWFSGKSKNLLFSLLIYPNKVLAKELFVLSQIASLVIKRTLSNFSKNISIKWPNDIYWNNKKIAGILIENNLEGEYIQQSIIGIGLNVNEDEFPDFLPNPVSLKQIIGRDIDRKELMQLIMREFQMFFNRLEAEEDGKIDEEYMVSLYWGEGYHLYKDKDGEFIARIEDVLPSGHLILRTKDEDENRTYAFKEVTFISE
ncbi:MAG: biotin--[acetyl-CoA-carboxylase] ligase [Dysgonamonadaceae bacterium]|jgi:BirA family biotin operon repressor/biotin-[acetyl-CoA-carboxylase] ligase|nr:biotin--[acetyl-CoA-carboxylase] ligase [Dysgonamonadaceae bacterium]